jgi:VWFA-related protein
MHRITTVFFLTLAMTLAQTPAPRAFSPQSPDTVIRITVNLVQVDAVVMDSKNKPVTDLRKEDFVILQDGKPQAITNFSFINTKEGVMRTAAAKPAPVVKGAKVPPPPPPMATMPKQIRRTVALVVDDLGLSFDSIARVRQSLKKYVDREMQPGDLVGVIRTGAGMGSLQQFTGNKQILYAAIDHVKYNSFGRVGISSFAPLGPDNGIDTSAADNERAQIFSAGTLGAIQYVVEGLRELPGRKSVVLFSENLKLMYAGEQSQRVQDSIRHLADAANRASVVIYSIDPRGLVYTGLTAADNTSGKTAAQISQVPMQRSQEMFDSQDGMVILAHETGGLFMQNTNDIDGALRHVLEDGDGYYLIGYHPDASTFDAKTGKPKFHSMQVRVKRAGLHVRNRSGFFGTSDRETEPVPRGRVAQIARAMASPIGAGALHLRLTTLFSQAAKTGPFLNSMLFFNPAELKFTDEPDDWHKAVIDIVAVTFGDQGQQVDGTDKTWTLRLKGDGYKDVLKNGMVYSVHVPVKKPGAYQVRVVLRDAGSELLGSASQFIEIPDIDKGRLALSGIVLRNEQPQAAAPAGPDHAEGHQVEGQQVEGHQVEGHQVEADPQGTPAVRIFKQGTTITYGYQILNAQENANKKPDLEVQTRLFRDGEQVYAGTPTPMAMGNQEDPKRLIGGGRMQLGGKIATGDYVLQVIVTDKLAKEKYRVATQSMDFEIQAAATAQQ